MAAKPFPPPARPDPFAKAGPAAPQPPGQVPGGAPVKTPATKTSARPADHFVSAPVAEPEQDTQTVGANPHPPATASQSEPVDTVIPYTAGSPTGFAPYGGWY